MRLLKGVVGEILCFSKVTDMPGDEIQSEGLCAVTFRNGATESILIVSDDGDSGDDTPGKYRLLSPEDYGILKKKSCFNN